jgi:hypothetical protein
MVQKEALADTPLCGGKVGEPRISRNQPRITGPKSRCGKCGCCADHSEIRRPHKPHEREVGYGSLRRNCTTFSGTKRAKRALYVYVDNFPFSGIRERLAHAPDLAAKAAIFRELSCG